MILGFLISIFNFVGLVRQVKKSFSGKLVASITSSSFFRLIITGIVLYLWFEYGALNIWGLLVGLTLLTITIPVYTIFANRRHFNGTSA
jgi:ABC-type transporter Mla maintaining outer membrane lipid asymmetry permease subunit MlaE